MHENREQGPTPFSEAEAMVQAWGVDHLQPVIAKSYAHKLSEAQLLLDQARNALRQSDLPADVQEAITFSLDFLQCQVDFTPPRNDWTLAEYQPIRERFTAPAQTAYGNVERVRRLMVVRYHADGDGFEELTLAEVEAMLDQLPEVNAELSVWHYVASWAFKRRNLPLLERAYEAHLIHPSALMGQAKFQRVNLMYLLVSGKATRRDVKESIKLLAIKPQLYEFMQELWPACVAAGITDPELAGKLEQRAQEIEQQSPEPLAEPRTKSIRGGEIYPEG